MSLDYSIIARYLLIILFFFAKALSFRSKIFFSVSVSVPVSAVKRTSVNLSLIQHDFGFTRRKNNNMF